MNSREVRSLEKDVRGLVAKALDKFLHRVDIFEAYDGLRIDIRLDSVTFAEMQILSKLFKTDRIDLDGGYEEGCPTCGGNSYIEVNIKRATMPKGEK